MSYHFLCCSRKIHYKTTFLHYYQVISTILGHLLTKAKTKGKGPKNEDGKNEFSSEMINNEDPDPESFHLHENVLINLLRAKSKDFYWLIVDKKCKEKQTGARTWNQTVPMDKTNWTNIFKSVPENDRLQKYKIKEKVKLGNFILNSSIEL